MPRVELPPLGRLVLRADMPLRDCRWCALPLDTAKSAKVCSRCDRVTNRVAA